VLCVVGDEVPEPARLFAVRRAMDVVRRDVQAPTWRAFEAAVIEDRPTAEVARELGITETYVRNAKSRIMKRLRMELREDS
jgi:RNA polymerase sigma-70 factor (ECF subfamily)